MIVSSLGFCISLPLWIIFCALIWIEDQGPIFYTQERVGKDGKIFRALKFRSMIKNAENGLPVQAIENDPRITRIGRFLRATAMDELPQLINIFKGEMSFVGPRALRPKEREVFGNSEVTELRNILGYKERHRVRPGLTGYAQVYLPPDAPSLEKFKYDLIYIEKMSFLLDLKLILFSFWISFRGKWQSRRKKI